MAEMERVRERERPAVEDMYERVLRYRQELADRNAFGPVVIKKASRKEFVVRQGRVRVYMDQATFPDVPLHMWRIFTHQVKTKSGKHRHQGGIIIYVLDGVGYSIVDGERKDWKKGDLILLPMKPEGVVHQHFNLRSPDEPALWVAFLNIPLMEHLASELKQEEPSPEYVEQQNMR